MAGRRTGRKRVRNLRALAIAALAVLALILARHCGWAGGGVLPKRGAASAGSGTEGSAGGNPPDAGAPRLPAPPGESMEELETLALARIEGGQAGEAIPVLLEILRRDPYHRDALDRLVTALVQTAPDPVAVHRLLASGIPGRAPDVLYAWSEERMDDDPESAGAILDLAIEAAREAGRPEDAERWSRLRNR